MKALRFLKAKWQNIAIVLLLLNLLVGTALPALADAIRIQAQPALNDIADVNAAAPSDDDVLSWDDGTSKWISEASPGGLWEIDGSDTQLITLDDIDFEKYKAIALICDNGATAPASPVKGQWFLHTPTGRNILLQHDGSNWIPIISLGTMTMYVDTAGTDDIDNGGASGASAFLTVQYAGDVIPGLVGGDVVTYIGVGTFADTITIQGKSFTGDYTISFYGAAFDDTALTIDSATRGTANSVTYGTITDNGSGWGLRATLESGNTDLIGVDTFVLRDSGQNFLTTCRVGMRIKNTSDDTWAYTLSVDSDTQLTLDTDIMDDAENYIIGWAEHKGTWITFDDATDTVALQGDTYLILENDSDTLTIVGRFDAAPAGADTAYISTLQTIISGKIAISTGQLGINFYRLDIDAGYYQINAFPYSESFFYYCDIKSVVTSGKVTFTGCFIHKEDDTSCANRLLYGGSKFAQCFLTSCLVDGEGLHYSTASSVRGIDINNGAEAGFLQPCSVLQNFYPKAGVTNYGVYMRVNAYFAMWAPACWNWIRFCNTGLDAALGSIGQYCISDTTYSDNFDDRNVDAATFAVVT